MCIDSGAPQLHDVRARRTRPYPSCIVAGNTAQLSNVKPVLIGNATDFSMLADQHYCFLRRSFPTFVEYDVEIGTYNDTIDAINDLPSILRPCACAALSQGCAILGIVLGFAVDYICSLSAGQT